jgi:DNA-directed RNA polymerase specialized sigma24 family protein
MDERHGNASSRRRIGSQSPTGAPPQRPGGQALLRADVATAAEESSQGATLTDTITGGPTPPDPRDPHTLERLRQRTPGGGYVVADAELVLAIRAWDARAMRSVAMDLCALLVDRCMPEFRRHAAGLRHRPDLMEDTIDGMIEQVLREALDPSEVFMTQNFIHYLRCLCADNFTRTLRQEGLSYKRDEQGRPTGRPQHIPRALIEQIDLHADEHDEQQGATGSVADPRDTLGERLAAVEAQRILAYLPDPLDQRIFALRALYKMQWEEIAALCGKTERTMRLRFEKAKVLLQRCLRAEVATAVGASGE